MQIRFEERPIFQASLSVLEHLYYRTIQYGLSVRDFTGEHQDYWERLPSRLRKAQNDPVQLDSIITELGRLAAGSEARLQKRRAQKEEKWAEKEIVLNAQLMAVLAALPEGLLGMGFRKATGSEALSLRPKIVDLVIPKEEGEDANFIEPDLLLLGDNHLLMIEVKTRGGEGSSRSYPAHQLLNYLQLVAKCQDSDGASLPNQFSHLILVPSEDLKWLEKHSEWVVKSSNDPRRLVVDTDACMRLGKPKASFDCERLKGLAREVPIYYRSWQQLYEAFNLAIDQFGDERNLEHWQRIGSEIKELAMRASRHS
jgi:hypothetical protein